MSVSLCLPHICFITVKAESYFFCLPLFALQNQLSFLGSFGGCCVFILLWPTSFSFFLPDPLPLFFLSFSGLMIGLKALAIFDKDSSTKPCCRSLWPVSRMVGWVMHTCRETEEEVHLCSFLLLFLSLLRFEHFCFVFTLPKISSLVFSVPLSPLLFSSMLCVRFR